MSDKNIRFLPHGSPRVDNYAHSIWFAGYEALITHYSCQLQALCDINATTETLNLLVELDFSCWKSGMLFV